ncbi:hypothetical protein [Nitrosomonas sp. Nm58]|uniref:hypothetical protein n=1 Tax=Nitrosomonas sp. Nm58 TaxID=200126 RepID=UPI000B807227|nr:hypothetical protein [Nitrosomonas sp. Nm58]
MATVRWRLFHLPGKVVRHARTAGAQDRPQGMRSIPKPIFNSFIPFALPGQSFAGTVRRIAPYVTEISETSPRWRYQTKVVEKPPGH